MKYLFLIWLLFGFYKVRNQPIIFNPPLQIVVPDRIDPTYGYLLEYGDLACDLSKEYGIPVEIMLAQAILESDRGRSAVAKATNNHFGVIRNKYGNFAAYASVKESFEQYAQILSSPRYSWMKSKYGNDWWKWADGVERSGYATAKGYALLIKKVVVKYDISKYQNGTGLRRTYNGWR